MNLIGLARGMEIAAGASGILLATRRPEHRPAALALVILAALDLVRVPLSSEGMRAAPVVLYLNGALAFGSCATVAILCVWIAVRAEQRRRALALGVALWAVASLAVAGLYPSPAVTGPAFQGLMFDVDLFCLFVSAVALFRWAADGVAAKRSPGSAAMIALALAALDAAILFPPFSPARGHLDTGDLSGIALMISVFFAVFTAAQVIAWKLSRRT